jgi:hypothetical protein
MKNKIPVITVKKILSDSEVSNLEGKLLKKGYFSRIFRNDVDVKLENGEYLLRFRKGILQKKNKKNINNAYIGLQPIVRKVVSTRGFAGGKNSKANIMNVDVNRKVASNIIGYFDTYSIQQHAIFRDAGVPKPPCRMTRFTERNVKEWNMVIPFIQDIDGAYKKLFPKHHLIQRKMAKATGHSIADTAFTTITTNHNFQTAVHTDRGNQAGGFGNLVIIQRGKFSGGYIGFPQYGVAVDLKEGDFLGMDVHQYHGNEPIVPESDDFERISLVSYLREGIVKKCTGMKKPVSRKFYQNVRSLAAAAKNKTKKKGKKKIGMNRKKKMGMDRKKKMEMGKTKKRKNLK